MIALLPLLATVACAGFGALALALSRAPGWASMRPTAAALFAGAGYAVTEAITTGRFSDGVHAAAGQASLLFATLHGLAWLRVVGAAEGGRPRLDRGIELASLVALLPALVPGLTHRAPILERTLPSLALTYRDATPTTLGLLLFAGQLLVLCLVSWRALRRARLASAGFAMLVVAGLLDSASTLELLPLPYLTSAAFAAMLLVAGLQTVRQFSQEAGAAEALALGLDAQVEEQSASLVQARAAVARAERHRALGELAAGVAEATLPLLSSTARLAASLGPGDFGDAAARSAALGRVEAARAGLASIARVGGDLLAASRIAAAAEGPATTGAAELLRAAVARVEARLPEGTLVLYDVDEALRVAGALELLVPALALAVERVGAELGPSAACAGLDLRALRRDGRVELVVQPGLGARSLTGSPGARARGAGGATHALGWAGALGLLRSQGGTVAEERARPGALRVRFSLAVA